jgi:hypothetical protein
MVIYLRRIPKIPPQYRWYKIFMLSLEIFEIKRADEKCIPGEPIDRGKPPVVFLVFVFEQVT